MNGFSTEGSMPASQRASHDGEANEWIDGFLFVANHPILDLLNTNPVLGGAATELLSDVRALERWLIASGIANSSRAKAAMRGWRNSTQATSFLDQLIAFRERLRESVVRIENGSLPGDAFVDDLNSLLIQHPLRTSLRKRQGKVVRESTFELRKPSDLWAPIIHAAADFLANADPSRVRQCESCVVHFFDTSKKGSRRWCSMNICGNKFKVAAYQQRRRDRDLTR